MRTKDLQKLIEMYDYEIEVDEPQVKSLTLALQRKSKRFKVVDKKDHSVFGFDTQEEMDAAQEILDGL